MNIRIMAFALLLVSAPAFAADVDGKWTGSLDTPGGPAPITEGKITGKKLSFKLTLDFGAGPTTFDITGEVSSPTRLKLHWEFMGMPTDVMLKKT
jgi:hypothetical protein